MRKRGRRGNEEYDRQQSSSIGIRQAPRVLNSCVERSDESLLRLFFFTRDLMQSRLRGGREGGGEDDERDQEERAAGAEESPPKWRDWKPYMVHERRVCEAGRVMSFDAGVLDRMSAEQRQALYLVEAGVGMFITGPGGTGKSEIIASIVGAGQAGGKKVVVTASTGIAAKNIRGTTLHRFARMGIRFAGVDPKKMRPSDPRLVCWRECDVLIVDEVSMLDIAFLSALDRIATHARGSHSHKPFGGIQLIFLGDFAQLTASSSGGAASCSSTVTTFTNPEWCRMVPFTVELRTIFRQRDGAFKDLLNRIRLGQVRRGDLLALNRRTEEEEELDPESSTVSQPAAAVAVAAAVTLCAFRKMVKRRNDESIAKLGEPVRTFCSGEDEEENKLTCLCVGSRVLLTRNTDLSRGLVNGSLGVVVGFQETSGWPVVRWDGGMGEAGGGGAAGQVELFTTVVEPVEKFGPVGEEHAAEADSASPRSSSGPNLPAVPSSPSSYVPLMCAWAMTVHRAQGMTLASANVHAQSMRTNALLYTALSRVRTLEGLRIVGQVSEENVVADPAVVKYYKKLAAMVDKQSSELGAHLAVVPSPLIQ